MPRSRGWLFHSLASLLLVLGGLACKAHSGEPTLPVTPREEAAKLAETTRHLIESVDSSGVLDLVDAEGVRCLDGHFSLEALRMEFAARKGVYYSLLFDTARLRDRLMGDEPRRLPEAAVSYRDFFLANPTAKVEMAWAGDGLSGSFYWKRNSDAIEVHSPIFQWRWDARRKKALILSIGCWMG